MRLICANFRFCALISASDLEFESPLRIVEYPDPVLRAKNKRIDTFDDNLKRLVSEMFDVMYKYVFITLLMNLKVKCFISI